MVQETRRDWLSSAGFLEELGKFGCMGLGVAVGDLEAICMMSMMK